MNILDPAHKEFLVCLCKRKVNFILAGGLAVNYHGYTRVTGDMDLFVEPTNENRDLIVLALMDYGFSQQDLQPVSNLNFSEAQCFHIGDDQEGRIDIINRISLVSWEEAAERALYFPLNEYQVRVLHLHHLVLSKTGTGRHMDMADIEKLQAIQKKRSSENKS
jgi:hypothetical protein